MSRSRGIVVLAHNLRSAGGLSVGRNVVATLPEVAPRHRYLVVVPSGCGYPEFRHSGNVDVMEYTGKGMVRRALWERQTLRRALKRFQPDWVWALGNMAVRPKPCRQSLLLHNPHRLYEIQESLCASLRERLFKRFSDDRFRRDLAAVDRVYCQTETMRKRLHEHLGYPLERIGLCPNAFSPSVAAANSWPSELESLRGKFVLFALTRYYRHKNLELIVEAFCRHRTELSDVACVLTIDPAQGAAAAQLIRRIQAEGLQEQILCVGAISQERLGQFYFAADALALPTLLESFSGTYLEAMQLDTPIITSDRDFAREVCGDAAVYIDPSSATDLKDVVLKLKESSALRKQLVAKGRERLRCFVRTWPEILRDVLEQEAIEHD